MSTATVLQGRFPRVFSRVKDFGAAPSRMLASMGHVGVFVGSAVGHIPHCLRYYRKEVLRLIAERLPVTLFLTLYAAVLGALCGVIGLYASYYLDLAPGATIVLVNTLVFLMVLVLRRRQ